MNGAGVAERAPPLAGARWRKRGIFLASPRDNTDEEAIVHTWKGWRLGKLYNNKTCIWFNKEYIFTPNVS